MSYSICRISKIKASGVTGIQIHDKREKGISHTNKDIAWDKTNENIELIEQKEVFRKAVKNRISELNLKRQPRSDATVMCQCLVTSDKDFFDKMSRQEQTEYFELSLEFIKKRYGAENIISATVHFDEKTPHMHVNFVPVTKDGRLSAKDLFSPKSLRVLQDDYNRFVKEQGYNLERGDMQSKTKHLDVEEYKIETRYEELKQKKAEIDKLEQIDKEVNLKAEKGKFTYSTKEVEDIKKQNKSLKLEIIKKENKIEQLKEKLVQTEKGLLKAQNELKDINVPLERLKDLESEIRALKTYRESHPQLDKVLQNYDALKNQAYRLGESLAKAKEEYRYSKEQMSQTIKRSSAYQNMARECVSKAEKLTNLQYKLDNSLDKERALQREIEGLQGIFKKKARAEKQAELDKQRANSEKLVGIIKAEHNCEPQYITNQIREYESQRINFLKEREENMKLTDQWEQRTIQAVMQYKYTKALSDTQSKDLKDITDRVDNRAEFRLGEIQTFRISHEDINIIIDRMEQRGQPKEIIEKVKQGFQQQCYRERQERDQSQGQNSGGRSRSRSHNYDREI